MKIELIGERHDGKIVDVQPDIREFYIPIIRPLTGIVATAFPELDVSGVSGVQRLVYEDTGKYTSNGARAFVFREIRDI